MRAKELICGIKMHYLTKFGTADVKFLTNDVYSCINSIKVILVVANHTYAIKFNLNHKAQLSALYLNIWIIFWSLLLSTGSNLLH